MGRDFDEYLELPSKAVTRAIKRTWKAAVRANDAHVTTGAMRYNWKLSKVRRSSYVPVRIKRPRPKVPKFHFSVKNDKQFYLYNNMPYAEKVEAMDPGNILAQASQFFGIAIAVELDGIRDYTP